MFLSEPFQRQYGRRHVTEHMTEPTYRRAIARRYVGSVTCPVIVSYHIDAEVAQKGT